MQERASHDQERASHDVTKTELKGTIATLEALRKYTSILKGETPDAENTPNSTGPIQDPEGSQDDVVMPLYNDRCGMEMSTGVCEKPRCAYLHQKQLDRYPAEAIATLHANHQDARRAKKCKHVNIHVHQNTPAAPPTPAEATESFSALTIAEDTVMVEDNGIEMPRFKGRCDLEYDGQCQRRTKCNYLHQAQVDKFPAEDIERLPVSSAAAHRAAKRKRVA
jgi:hypothetical protein